MSERDDAMLHRRVLACAERIEAAAAAWDLLEEHEGESSGDVYATHGSEADAKVRAARRALELEPVDEVDDVAEGLDELDPDEALLDGPLSVVVQGRFWDSSWEVTGVEVVICTGGPHIELRYDGRGMSLYGFWGGSRVEGMPVDSDRAAALLDEAMAVVEQY